MTNRDNLPAKASTANVVVPTNQSGSLVARGLEAIRNRSELALSLPSETALEELFRNACDRGDYESALRTIHVLANRRSALAEELCSDLFAETQPSCLSYGDDEDDANEEARAENCQSCLRNAAEQGDVLAQDLLVGSIVIVHAVTKVILRITPKP
jgi:hypothetical protein